MSKRNAETQLSKEGGFNGDGSGAMFDDTPRKATAAQMASRKIKTLKPKRGGTPSRSESPPVNFGVNPGAGQNNAFGGFGSNVGTTNTNGAAFSFPPANPPQQNGTASASSSFGGFGSGGAVGGFNSGGIDFSFGNKPASVTSGFAFSAGGSGQNNTMNGDSAPSFQPPSTGFNFNPQPTNGNAAPQSNPFNFGGNQTPGSNLFGTQAPASSTPNFFGGSASTPAPTNGTAAPVFSLFGSNNASDAPASNPFGASNAAPSNPPSNMFGAFTTPAPTSNLFGTPNKDAPASNLFGSTANGSAPMFNLNASTSATPNTGAASNPFASLPNTSQEQTPTKPLFGELSNAAQAPQTPASSAPSTTFGSFTAPPVSKTGGSLFGFGDAAAKLAAPSTPAPAPSSSLFNFGQAPATAAPSAPFNLFGPKQDQPAASPSKDAQTLAPKVNGEAPKSNTFGFLSGSTSGPSSTPNFFSKPADTTPAEAGAAMVLPENEEDSAPKTAAPKTSVGNAFTKLPRPAEEAPAKPTTSLFAPSATPPSGGNMFGNFSIPPAMNTLTGNSPAKSADSQPPTSSPAKPLTSSLFSHPTTSQPSSGFNFGSFNPTGSTALSPAKPAEQAPSTQSPLKSQNSLFSESSPAKPSAPYSKATSTDDFYKKLTPDQKQLFDKGIAFRQLNTAFTLQLREQRQTADFSDICQSYIDAASKITGRKVDKPASATIPTANGINATPPSSSLFSSATGQTNAKSPRRETAVPEVNGTPSNVFSGFKPTTTPSFGAGNNSGSLFGSSKQTPAAKTAATVDDTPERPAFSPFTPPVNSPSKRKADDEVTEQTNGISTSPKKPKSDFGPSASKSSSTSRAMEEIFNKTPTSSPAKTSGASTTEQPTSNIFGASIAGSIAPPAPESEVTTTKSPEKPTGPPKFEPPKFNVGGKTNFLSQFSRNAVTDDDSDSDDDKPAPAPELKNKPIFAPVTNGFAAFAKAAKPVNSDTDSDDESEDESAKKAKSDDKTASTAKEATLEAPATSRQGSAQPSNSLFVSRNPSPTPSTTGGRSVFDSPAPSGSTTNIFGHLPSPAANADDDEDEDADKENDASASTGGGLFSRITREKNPEGGDSQESEDANKENAGPSSSPAFAGDRTWNPNSPIKFGNAASSSTSSNPFGFGSPAKPLFSSTPAKAPMPAFSFSPATPPTTLGSENKENNNTEAPKAFSFLNSNSGSASGSNILNSALKPASAPSLFSSAATSRATTPGATTDGGESSAEADGTAPERTEDEAEGAHGHHLTALSEQEKADNDVLLEIEKCKARMLVEKKYEDLGLGPLRLLKDKKTGKTRILMRKVNGHIALNSFLMKEGIYAVTEAAPKNARLSLFVDNKPANILITVGDKFKDQAKKLAELCEEHKRDGISRHFQGGSLSSLTAHQAIKFGVPSNTLAIRSYSKGNHGYMNPITPAVDNVRSMFPEDQAKNLVGKHGNGNFPEDPLNQWWRYEE